MQLKDVGASLRRHWPVALAIFLLIPIVLGIVLWNRDTSRPPARYTTSSDVLIPTRDEQTGEAPSTVPPVLFQGQVELALSPQTKAFTIRSAHLPFDDVRGATFNASLSEDASIMTLSVSAPKPETASTLLDQYVIAYQEGRRQSVLDAAIDQQDIEERVIKVLNQKLTTLQGQLIATGVTAFPPQVEDGTPVPGTEGMSNDAVLLLYQRNAVLNETQRRQVDYSLQSTYATIPGDYTTIVQRRSTARVTPPPPSPWPTVLEILGVGILLVLAVPLLMDRFDRSVTDERTASATLRARVLGTIPPLSRRLRHGYAHGGSSWDVAFRSLAATSISTDNLPKALMVTAPVDTVQDTVAANFARGLAALGARVVLIATAPHQRWFLWGDQPQLDDDGDEPEPHEPAAISESASSPGTPDAPDTPGAGDAPGDAGGPSAETGEVVPVAPAGVPLSEVPTFQDLLREAQNGLVPEGLLGRLATVGSENLYVVPPGSDPELSLDGLPPLLEAFTQSGVEVIILAGPPLLEDPNATIMAWSTRNVLWALEIGHVHGKDAQLAADRLEIAGVLPFGIAVVERHIR